MEKKELVNKEFGVINLKSRKFRSANEYRVCEVIDSNTFIATNGAITKKDGKRFNWCMTGFKTEEAARKWLLDYRERNGKKC